MEIEKVYLEMKENIQISWIDHGGIPGNINPGIQRECELDWRKEIFEEPVMKRAEQIETMASARTCGDSYYTDLFME